MRKIPVCDAQPNMILARSLYSSDGKILLGAGVKLTVKYLQRLSELGIPAIYVRNDEPDEEVSIPDVLKDETRAYAVKSLKENYAQIQRGQSMDANNLKELAENILDEVFANRQLMIHMNDVRCYDDYTFAHSVNVCVLSVMTGITLSYNQLQLRELAIGALLHDVGKTLVPCEILNKPGRLTSEEFEIMKTHSSLGFEILRNYKDIIPLLSAHVALQHQEKFDGTGYPRGLKGEDIHEFARVVAVADVYDALVADRVYRQGYLPYEAYEIILASSLSHFDQRIAKAFLENIAMYPIGSPVQLNTGEIGVVVAVNKAYQNRPTVRLLIDGNGRQFPNHPEVDLMKSHTHFVTRVVKDYYQKDLAMAAFGR